MRKVLTIILFSVLSLTIAAEDVIIALLQPLTVSGTTACDPFEVSIVRGELRKAFGWQSGYQVVSRLDVDAIMKEMGFQQSGMVSDNQRKKVGEMTSAQYICVSSITKYGTQLYIEAYLVNVETGQMTNPATQYANVKNEDYSTLPSSCTALAEEMLGAISGAVKRPPVRGGGVNRQPVNQDFVETAWDINMKMIWVEGGDFLMGCTSEQGSCYDDEKNVRRVTVDGFYIGMLEVTQAQWEKVIGTSIYQQRNKANSSYSIYGAGADYPMYYVSWEEAMEFCRLLSNKTGKTYTLPTEAQWEYAARGGKKADGTQYAGSNMVDVVAWYTGNSGQTTHPCGTKRANALGIYDMSGNVWEWCKDWYGSSYPSYDTNNPTGPSSGSSRVLRGGSWNNNAGGCRVANRNSGSRGYRGNGLGFRVVLLP
ncbi:MAG: SUMF1/EgtB/PvdO family nonheme iron enzyme [Paludibacteraceae bacterium]|nr:SUMF1/EgtB/PvdO family nonheme iron enzyme [Paludibacteraceae bacterium]